MPGIRRAKSKMTGRDVLIVNVPTIEACRGIAELCLDNTPVLTTKEVDLMSDHPTREIVDAIFTVKSVFRFCEVQKIGNSDECEIKHGSWVEPRREPQQLKLL